MVPIGPGAAAAARKLVRALADQLPAAVVEDASLVVSELVTNSYQHAGLPDGTPVDVVIDLTNERLRIEVVDHSVFDPTPETSKELRSARWGLMIVDRTADDWGRISEGGIWAEFRLR